MMFDLKSLPRNAIFMDWIAFDFKSNFVFILRELVYMNQPKNKILTFSDGH